MKTGRMSHLAMLVILVMTTYFRALLNGFVWDDFHCLVGVEVYKRFDVIGMFTTLANGIEYFPVRDLTLGLDYALFRGSTFGFHLSNLLYFSCAVVAVYFLTSELLRLPGAGSSDDHDRACFIPLLTSALFAVHPLNGEAVNWISGRNVILGGLFFFLSALFFLKSARPGGKVGHDYFLSVAFFLLALLSKATVIILPAVLCAVTMVFSENRRRSAWLLTPFFTLSVAFYFVFTRVGTSAKIINRNTVESVTSGLSAKISTAAQIPYFYIGKFFFPARYSTHYFTGFSPNMASLRVTLSILGISAFVVMLFAWRRRFPEASCGSLWFIVALVPVMNFFATTPVVADRYAFIPLYGLCFLVAALLARLGAASVSLRNGVAAGMLLILAVISFLRVGYWQDEKSLWKVTLRNTPESIAGYIGLGAAYFNEGNYEKALEYYGKIRDVRPPNTEYENALGKYYIIMAQYDKAVEAYQAALVKKPDSSEALYNLGLIFSDRGDADRAKGYFSRVLTSGEVNHNLVADAEAKLASMVEGGGQGSGRLRADVKRELAYLGLRGKLALQLDSQGRDDDALRLYLEMERLGMKQWQLYYNIGTIYGKKRLPQEAADYFRRSLALNPNNPDALNSLGVACRDLKQYAEAVASLSHAMSLAPRHAYAPLNLAITYHRMGDSEKAGQLFAKVRREFPGLSGEIDGYLKE